MAEMPLSASHSEYCCLLSRRLLLKSALPCSESCICSLNWWTAGAHNDSGNATAFSEINPESGLVIRTITPTGAHNRDWEDAASTGDTLFIGDFGNNSNNRTDLGIYSIPLSAIQNSGNPVVPDGSYSFIPYAYGRLVQQFGNPESGMSVQLETGCYFIVSQWENGKTGVTRLVFNWIR